jgi:Mrp family chromosome partitioning ATPase
MPAVSTAGTDLLVVEAGFPAAARAAYEEAFLNLKFALLTAPGSTVLVAPIDASTSAAALAANLAILSAQENETTILVDADYYTPTLGTLFALAPSAGFRDLIQSETPDIAPCLNAAADVPGLYLMAAGAGAPLPGGVGRARQTREVLAQCKNSADRVIVIGIPLLERVDSLDLCQFVDGVVVTVSPGKTHRQKAARARLLLDRVKAPLLGVVLTGKPT